MKTAFVTGATGFVGLNVVEELVRQGWRVVALHRATSRVAALARLPVELVAGDLADPESLRRGIPEGADAVFHVAGNTSLWRSGDAEQTRDNVEGTRHVVEAALQRRVKRLVHTSSAAAFGQHGTRVTEETPSTAAVSAINYFRSKWLGEQVVVEAGARGLDAVILNPANIVGPHDRQNWSRVFRLVADGKLPGVPPGKNSWCHSREVARAHVAAAERGRRGERYLLACVDASYLDLVQTIAEIAGRPVPRRASPAVVLRAFAALADLASRFTGHEPDVTPGGVAIVCDTTTFSSEKARRELGYRPSTLRAMVEDCWTWMKAEGLAR